MIDALKVKESSEGRAKKEKANANVTRDTKGRSPIFIRRRIFIEAIDFLSSFFFFYNQVLETNGKTKCKKLSFLI